MQELENYPQFEPYHMKSYKGRNSTYKRWSSVVLPDWEGAACASVDPELFFVERNEYSKIPIAKNICSSCAIRSMCLAYALEHNIIYGIWGGSTPTERRIITRLNLHKWRAAK